MTGAGCGLMVTFIDTVESHEAALVSVRVIVPVPKVVQRMVMELRDKLMMLPPVTLQLYVVAQDNTEEYV